MEGYVYHTYGPDKYVRHAVASVITLRRYDAVRPVALYCPEPHREALAAAGLEDVFSVILPLPEANRSITGFKHNLHRFMPFQRCLFLDADMVWCRDPESLWSHLQPYGFTATGHERADFFFGGPKGLSVLMDVAADRRRRTMRRFGLTHLPRVQAGMIYSGDPTLAGEVSELAAEYLTRRDETHFRSRLHEGRSEESCEWSMAMAMSRLALPVYPWFQGLNSPQLDFIEGLTTFDQDFRNVTCRYYCDRFVYSLRGVANDRLRRLALSLFSGLPGRGDFIDVTPFVLHFGWLRHKQPFHDLSERIWSTISAPPEPSTPVMERRSDIAVSP